MKLELKVGDTYYSGWENVSISKSMTSIADTLSISILGGDNISIADDDVIEILADGDVFFTGYPDMINFCISDTKKPLAIDARSKACDLIDCNIIETKQYINKDIVSIISDIASPFDLKIKTDIKKTNISVFVTKIGESYFDAINRLCKQTNTLPVSMSNGDVLITKNRTKDSGIVLTDNDFKSLTYRRNLKERHSKFIYRVESLIKDTKDGIVKDDTVKRFRPFVAVNTEDKPNEDMAKWKYNIQRSKAFALSAVVHGWKLNINEIVTLKTSIINNSFLIKEIRYEKSDSGTVSYLTLVQKDLFNV